MSQWNTGQRKPKCIHLAGSPCLALCFRAAPSLLLSATGISLGWPGCLWKWDWVASTYGTSIGNCSFHHHDPSPDGLLWQTGSQDKVQEDIGLSYGHLQLQRASDALFSPCCVHLFWGMEFQFCLALCMILFVSLPWDPGGGSEKSSLLHAKSPNLRAACFSGNL